MNPGEEGWCGMTPDQREVRWRKSSRSSGQNGDCVEIADVGAVRDSKNPAGPALRAALPTLIEVVKTGRLDR